MLIVKAREYPVGWRLTPVRGKRPTEPDWRNKVIPFEQIAESLRSGAATGIGVVLGPQSGGLVAVDVDGEEAAKLCGDLPDTVTSTSGKPGRATYYYLLPERLWEAARHRRIDAGNRQQLELRWTGQQVVPPSIHPETRQPYRWLRSPEEVGVAMAPRWLIERMCEPDPSLSPSTNTVDLVQCLAKSNQEALKGVNEGGRDNAGAALARDLIGVANYLTSFGIRFEGDPYQLLSDFCARCNPPLTKKDCDRLYKSAERSNPVPAIPLDKLQARINWQQGKRVSQVLPTPQMVEAVGNPDIYRERDVVNAKVIELQAQKEEIAAQLLALQSQKLKADPIRAGELKGEIETIRLKLKLVTEDLNTAKSTRYQLSAAIRRAEQEELRRQRAEVKDRRTPFAKDNEVVTSMLAGRLRYNVLTNEIELDGHPIQFEAVRSQLTRLLGHSNWHCSDDAVFRMVLDVAKQQEFNPVQDYLNGVRDLAGDPDLLDTLAEFLFGVTDPLQNSYLKATLVGAVRRAYNPGCRHIGMLILYSRRQQIGKSTAIRALFGDQFTGAGYLDVTNPDSVQKFTGRWVWEFAECEKLFHSKTAGEVKAFLTYTEDSVRLPYARNVIRPKRMTLFVGTTNERNILNDGINVRQWVIEIPNNWEIPTEWIAENRDLIWSAAVAAEQRGDPNDVDMAATNERNKAYQDADDGWQEAVQDYMQRVGYATTAEILTQSAIKMELAKITQRETRRVARLLRALDYEQRAVKVRGKFQRRWEKITD